MAVPPCCRRGRPVLRTMGARPSAVSGLGPRHAALAAAIAIQKEVWPLHTRISTSSHRQHTAQMPGFGWLDDPFDKSSTAKLTVRKVCAAFNLFSSRRRK